MGNLLMLSEASTTEASGYADVSSIVTLMKNGVSGVFDIAGSAFGFLMDNPLCAFMVCVGFAYVALGLVRRAIKVSKRT